MKAGKKGRKPAVFDPKTRLLSKYLDWAALPPIPKAQGWDTTTQRWGMFLNDTIGDCTIAAVAHIIMEGQLANAQSVTPTDTEVLTAYEAISGYNPDDPSTDTGCVMLDVMTVWRDTGICANKSLEFLSIEPGNIELVKAAIYLFGAVDIGVNLPQSADTQFEHRKPWALVPGYRHDPIVGGHSISVFDYADGWFWAVTWGQAQKISAAWFAYYCDEAYAILDNTWIGPDAKAPNGFDLAQLKKDLNAIG